MSFLCEGSCGQAQPAGAQPVMVVTQIREVIYQGTRILRTVKEFSSGFSKVNSREESFTSKGAEIARAERWCPTCAKDAPEPRVVGTKTVHA